MQGRRRCDRAPDPSGGDVQHLRSAATRCSGVCVHPGGRTDQPHAVLDRLDGDGIAASPAVQPLARCPRQGLHARGGRPGTARRSSSRSGNPAATTSTSTSLHRLKSPRATEPNTTTARTSRSVGSVLAKRSARPISSSRSARRRRTARSTGIVPAPGWASAPVVQRRLPARNSLLLGQGSIPGGIDEPQDVLCVVDRLLGVGGAVVPTRGASGVRVGVAAGDVVAGQVGERVRTPSSRSSPRAAAARPPSSGRSWPHPPVPRPWSRPSRANWAACSARKHA